MVGARNGITGCRCYNINGRCYNINGCSWAQHQWVVSVMTSLGLLHRPLWTLRVVSSHSFTQLNLPLQHSTCVYLIRTLLSLTGCGQVTMEQLSVGLWTAQGIGGVFPGSRLRQIRSAQDVLTHTEETVYDVFWGSKNPSSDPERIVTKGYDKTAKEAQITKRNIVNIVQRLIDKGFLEVVAPPTVYGQRRAATYRVLSYATVRENQKRRGQDWVIHVGSGIGYACRIEGAITDVDRATAPSGRRK
jgi:hypothetical protein